MNERHPAYLKALTFPRFVLAMLVVIFHFGLHLPFFSESYFSDIFNHGAVAVSFFFFLSGFVLAYNYGKDTSPRHFILKRLFRIYPIYILTFLIVLCSMYFMGKDIPNAFFVIMNALGLHSWIPGYALQLNFPSWSISVEFFLYATFPVLLWIHYKLKWKFFALLSIFIILVGGVQNYYAVTYLADPDRYFLSQFILYFPIFHFSTFVAGFFCGKWLYHLQKKNIPHWVYTISATLGIILYVLIMNFENPLRPLTHNSGLIPVFILICLGLALDKKFYAKIFGNQSMVYLGNISYGIYMWQFPVFLWFTYYMQTEKLSSLAFVNYLFILMLWSALSYEFIEKPIRKKLSKKYI